MLFTHSSDGSRASSILGKCSSRVLHPDPEHPLRLAEGLLASKQQEFEFSVMSVCLVSFYFDTGSCPIREQAGLKLKILRPQHPRAGNIREDHHMWLRIGMAKAIFKSSKLRKC